MCVNCRTYVYQCDMLSKVAVFCDLGLFAPSTTDSSLTPSGARDGAEKSDNVLVLPPAYSQRASSAARVGPRSAAVPYTTPRIVSRTPDAGYDPAVALVQTYTFLTARAPRTSTHYH